MDFTGKCKVFLSPAKSGNCEMKNKNSYLSIYIKFLIDKNQNCLYINFKRLSAYCVKFFIVD
ncbi:hypothetical protein EWP66_03480 [Neisseria meningitidis]|nr:hypothetical protein [Neisseria meningitidis]